MAATWLHFITISALAIVPVMCTLVTLTENGGYKQIVVAISPKVNRSEIEDLLLDLEELFTEASRFQHTATRNQTYFEEVVVLLPKSFQDASLPENKVAVLGRNYFSSPDIFITDETIFGKRPFTVQNSGCGERGLHIKIPASFFKPGQDGRRQLHLTNRAKVLVHEWAHYRYGVFDENGFLGDELYPLYYSIPGQSDERNLRITACTNKKVPFVLRNFFGEKCQEFEEGCWPFIENNEGIVSSLMYDPSLPKINQFCDGGEFDHDRDAPTKQNALCREESTWNVISRNDDFKTKRNTRTKNNFIPVFKYSIEMEPKIVFVVEATESMGINDKMNQVQNAFSYFVLYDLPVNSQVGIISMKSVDSVAAKPLFLKLTSNMERERLCDAFPDPYGKGDVCVHCRIRRALEVLNSDKNPSVSGTVILVTTKDVSLGWSETLTQELSKADVKLFVIFFSMVNNKVPLLQNIAQTSGGQLFIIPEKPSVALFHPPLAVLYEAFRTIYRSLSWTYETDTLVTQKTFRHSTSENSLPFSIDESISSFRLILTVPSFGGAFPVVKDEVVLKSQNFEFRTGDTSFSYKSKIPAYVFTITNPEPGNWTLKFRMKSGFTKYLSAMVRASQLGNESVSVHSWIKPLNGTTKPPGIIYAEVFKGTRPILNANVTALVLHPDLIRVSKLSLLDAGEGDPDITRNDGIYSRYFTDFSSEGYYTLAVFVHYSSSEDSEKRMGHDEISSSSVSGYVRCCGSSFPTDNQSISDDFTREHIVGNFHVKMNQSRDSLPPRRIVDLKVVNVLWLKNGIKHFTLQWSAPGNDYDYGTAHAYEIKVFKSREDALVNFESGQILTIDEWKTHGPWLQPEPAGTIQVTTIELGGIPSGIYFLAMRAIDSSGNTGDVSNVVKVYHDEIPSVDSSSVTNHVVDPDILLTTAVSESTTSATGASEKTGDLNLIIVITCVLLLLMIIIAFVLFIWFQRHRKLQEMKKADSPTFHLDENRNASNDTLCRSESSGGRENESISVISPVASWPAETLLSHYEMVRDIKFNSRSTPPLKQEQNGFDTISQTSSVYASIHRNPEKNSAMHNQMYYQEPNYREINNYPFNPAYTSSLRRQHGHNNLSSRLNTDV